MPGNDGCPARRHPGSRGFDPDRVRRHVDGGSAGLVNRWSQTLRGDGRSTGTVSKTKLGMPAFMGGLRTQQPINITESWSDGLESVADFTDALALEYERVAAGYAPFWHYSRLGRTASSCSTFTRCSRSRRCATSSASRITPGPPLDPSRR
jgi:hypothetical protein